MQQNISKAVNKQYKAVTLAVHRFQLLTKIQLFISMKNNKTFSHEYYI